MADVTGPISTLPGASHAVPDGTKCDRHPRRKAVARIQGDPISNDWTTHYYGGASIFSYSLTDEATVMKRNKPYVPAWRALAAPAEPTGQEDDDGVPFDDGQREGADD